MSRKEGECALLVMWVSCQQLTQLVSLQVLGVSRGFVPERDSLCVKEAVCSLGGRACMDQISISGRRRLPAALEEASQGRSSSCCHCFLNARVPAVCLSAGGCASPPSPIPAPNPSRRGRFGLLRPAVVGIGGAQGGRSTFRRRSPDSKEPISLGSSSPAAMAIGLDQH